MNPRVLLGIACLIAGIALAAWSLASGQLVLALVGFALIFTFIYLAMEAMGKAGKPQESLKKAANAAWSMKDTPAGGNDSGGAR